MNALARTLQPRIIQLEKYLVRRHRLPPIPGSEWQAFLVDLQFYRGRTITLPDQTCIKRGDPIAELHINNLITRDLDLDVPRIFRIFRQELDAAARACLTIPEYGEIKAFYGRTILYAFALRCGFAAVPIRNPLLRTFLNWWGFVLRQAFSGQGRFGRSPQPMEVWISREKLIAGASAPGPARNGATGQ